MIPYPAFSKNKVYDKDRQLLRVYGTLGDAYLQERAVASLIEWALPEEDARDFNLDVLDGETASVTDVLASAGNLPFLAERRVVHVRRAERIENINRNSAGEEENDDSSASAKGKLSPAKRLTQGLSTLPATTVLILSRTAETPEPGARASTPRCINAAIDKAIESKPKDNNPNGLIIDCTIGAKAAALAVDVVLGEANQRGIHVEKPAVAHLVERIGHDVTYLLQELEKCALRVGPGEIITPEIVNEMTRRTLQETIFNLTDAIGERRTPQAIATMRELMANNYAPQQILATLANHVKLLLQARAFLDAGLKLDSSLPRRLPPEIARQLPQDGRYNLANMFQSQSWRAGKIGQQARNFQTPQLQRALQAALETDLALKGIEADGGTPELMMDLLVTRLTHS